MPPEPNIQPPQNNQPNSQPTAETQDRNQPVGSSYAQPMSPVPQKTETATVPLIVSGFGLVAWIIPILGFPVTIVALVLSSKAMKVGQKLAKLSLTLAIVGLVATIVNSAIGAYQGYTGQLWFQEADSQTSTDSTTGNDNNANSTDFQRYPEVSRTAFIDSCTASGGSQSQCSCMLNGIENELTYEEFAEVDREIAQTGFAPESFLQVQAEIQRVCQ